MPMSFAQKNSLGVLKELLFKPLRNLNHKSSQNQNLKSRLFNISFLRTAVDSLFSGFLATSCLLFPINLIHHGRSTDDESLEFSCMLS